MKMSSTTASNEAVSTTTANDWRGLEPTYTIAGRYSISNVYYSRKVLNRRTKCAVVHDICCVVVVGVVIWECVLNAALARLVSPQPGVRQLVRPNPISPFNIVVHQTLLNNSIRIRQYNFL